MKNTVSSFGGSLTPPLSKKGGCSSWSGQIIISIATSFIAGSLPEDPPGAAWYTGPVPYWRSLCGLHKWKPRGVLPGAVTPTSFNPMIMVMQFYNWLSVFYLSLLMSILHNHIFMLLFAQIFFFLLFHDPLFFDKSGVMLSLRKGKIHKYKKCVFSKVQWPNPTPNTGG